jgi:hypothetical protein
MRRGVDAPSKNEYQGFPLGAKAAGAWGWRPTTLVVPNVKKIRVLNLPGTPLGPCGLLWAWPKKCNNNNNNNNLILLFKIPMGTRKNFFEIYKPFGHAPSKRFATPSLSCILGLDKFLAVDFDPFVLLLRQQRRKNTNRRCERKSHKRWDWQRPPPRVKIVDPLAQPKGSSENSLCIVFTF